MQFLMGVCIQHRGHWQYYFMQQNAPWKYAYVHHKLPPLQVGLKHTPRNNRENCSLGLHTTKTVNPVLSTSSILSNLS